MPPELSKSFDPAAVEAEVYDFWLKNGCFTADPAKPGDPYSIVIPPPNVTGALHLGHAINNTLQDILTRVHRMRRLQHGLDPRHRPRRHRHAGGGRKTAEGEGEQDPARRRPGRAGRADLGLEAAVRRPHPHRSCNASAAVATGAAPGSRWTTCAPKPCGRRSSSCLSDGLVYRGKRLVNWDTHLLTSISDDELYTENGEDFDVAHQVSDRRHRPIHDRRHHAARDAAGRHRRRRSPRRPAVELGDREAASACR